MTLREMIRAIRSMMERVEAQEQLVIALTKQLDDLKAANVPKPKRAYKRRGTDS